MRKLDLGKIPIELLDRTVLRLTGFPSRRVVAGPKAGVDFAAIKLDGGYLVVSSDPITGISSVVGRYSIVVSGNDVATSGNAPQFMESVILMPTGSTAGTLRALAAEMNAAARSLGVTLVGGHTEVTPGLTRPIVAVTAFSFVSSFVSSAMARPGDSILMTKTAGLEGTAALAREAKTMRKRLSAGLVAEAAAMERGLSVVREATAASRTGRIHAMHDCTEGGLVGAVYEMSLASGLGFELWGGSVPVAPTTRDICGKFSLDPLRLIGSGSMLIAVPEEEVVRVSKAVGRAARVTRIGKFTRGRRLLVGSDGREEVVRSAPEDELWRALGRSG